MIADIHLQHFRSYTDSLFEFDPGVNIIVGPNASGKTNLLESVLVLCQGKSYRVNDHDLIQNGRDWARLDGNINAQPRSVKWRLGNDNLKTEYLIGGTKLLRLLPARRVPTVVFEPQNLQLLTQSPELRRQFIDDLIEQVTPGFGSLRRQYKRTLAQRNSLLKQDKPDENFFVWDVRLSELGGQIADKRRAFIKEHQSELEELYDQLASKKDKVNLKYQTKLSSKDYTNHMLKNLKERLSIDKQRGYTTIGPHRDDIVPELDGRALSVHASRGETRTLLLALKLLEVRTIEKHLEQKPVLLLDDVFSELDGARRKSLTHQLQDHQTFITTTDADIVVQHFLNNCRIIPTSS